jgi:hypothetical protein
MLAVECLLDRHDKRFPARVVRQHSNPRDGLQRQPVPPENLHGGEKHDYLGEAGEHYGQS